MAEQLGQAELVITVNDKDALRKLGELKKQVADFENQAVRPRRATAATPKPKSGLSDFLRELRVREQSETAADQRIARKREERRTRDAAKRAKEQRIAAAAEIGASPVQGNLRLVGSPRFSARGARQGGARESIDALTNAQKRRYKLDQQIRSLEAAGVKTDKLRVQLGAVTDAQINRRFGTFKQLSSQLEFQLKKERDILDTRQRQERVATRETRAREAEARRIGRLNASPVQGGVAFPGSPNAIRARDAEARRIARQNVLPVGGLESIPSSPAGIKALERRRKDEERRLQAVERRRQSQEQRQLAEGRRIGRLNASPVRGGTAFPGSPAFLDAQFPAFPAEFFRKQKQDQTKQQRIIEQGIKRRADILSNALIGGAFPALFGQGLGASIGGAAGGAAGGALGGQFGFGLSLIGTALGAQFDLAAQKSKTLAEALNDPIGKFAELVEAGLLSSKALERNAKALIESGRAAEAAALIQLDLNKTFAGTATGGELTSVTDELGRAFTRLSVSMTQFSSGPLTGLLKLLGARFENDFQRNRSVQIESELRQAGLGSQADELRRRQFVPILESDTAEISRINEEFVNKIPRVQKANAQANADIAASQRSIEASQRLGFKITQASTQGYKIQTLELQKQEVLNARNRKLLELKPQERTGIRAQDIQADAAQKLFDLDTQINETRQDRLATANQEATQNAIALQAVRDRISAAEQLSGIEAGIVRSTAEQVLNIRNGIAEAKRREQQLGADIDAARLRGGDAGEAEAARLVGQQQVAAEETKLRLIEGASALRSAGQQLQKDATAAANALQSLRASNFQFLSPQEQRATFERARSDAARQASLAGVKFNVRGGTLEEQTRLFQGFADFRRQEQALSSQASDIQTAISLANTGLVDVNTQLVNTNQELTAAVNALVSKDWTVNTYVNAGTDTQSRADILAAATLP